MPINPLARRFAFSERASISVPARNVSTPLPSSARKLIQSVVAWIPRKFPAITPTRISTSATDIPAQIEIRLAARASAIQIAAINQTFCVTDSSIAFRRWQESLAHAVLPFRKANSIVLAGFYQHLCFGSTKGNERLRVG